MSKTIQPTEENEPTDVEIAEMRSRMHEHYVSEIPMLKVQLEYENTIAGIEEARLKRVTCTMRIAQIMAGPQQETPNQEKQERKLKVEKS
jgi:hypothetical protein